MFLLDRKYVYNLLWLLQVSEQVTFGGDTLITNCNEWILNADRVMAIQETKYFFEDLWTKSSCASMLLSWLRCSARPKLQIYIVFVILCLVITFYKNCTLLGTVTTLLRAVRYSELCVTLYFTWLLCIVQCCTVRYTATVLHAVTVHHTGLVQSCVMYSSCVKYYVTRNCAMSQGCTYVLPNTVICHTELYVKQQTVRSASLCATQRRV